MAHDASHNPNLSGADPQDRPAGGDARFGAKTILLLVFGVLLVALGHPTKGPELARILGRFRKRHLDLIVGRVVEGLRLAEELEPTKDAREKREERLDALKRAIPMRRLAEPEDIAHAVAYFASVGAGYVTGQILSVSGGLTMSG